MKFDNGIKNKCILLVGATGSLGKTHAQILSERTSKLVISDLPGSGVKELADSLKINFVEMDVTKETSVKEGIKKVIKLYGCIDGAIFNSAITSDGIKDKKKYKLKDYPLKLWKKAIDVNLTGAFLFSKYLSDHVKLSQGSIILISSIYGIRGPDHSIYNKQSFSSFPAYSASKAGIIGLTKWLATSLASYNVRVNCISPGGVFNNHNDEFIKLYSNRVPLKRMANKDDMTGAIIYLLSDSSKYTTGQNIVIDGGLSSW